MAGGPNSVRTREDRIQDCLESLDQFLLDENISPAVLENMLQKLELQLIDEFGIGEPRELIDQYVASVKSESKVDPRAVVNERKKLATAISFRLAA